MNFFQVDDAVFEEKFNSGKFGLPDKILKFDFPSVKVLTTKFQMC